MLGAFQHQDLTQYNSLSGCEVVPKTAGRIDVQLASAGKLLRAQSSDKDLLTCHCRSGCFLVHGSKSLNSSADFSCNAEHGTLAMHLDVELVRISQAALLSWRQPTGRYSLTWADPDEQLCSRPSTAPLQTKTTTAKPLHRITVNAACNHRCSENLAVSTRGSDK